MRHGDESSEQRQIADSLRRVRDAYAGKVTVALVGSGRPGNMDPKDKARCDRMGTLEQLERRLRCATPRRVDECS